MRETLGWIIGGLGGLCALAVARRSARGEGVPAGLVFVGLGLSLFGMYLIGMFG